MTSVAPRRAGADRSRRERRFRRLVEELAEEGFVLEGPTAWRSLVLPELDHALRPPVHEGRVPSYGAIVAPDVPSAGWDEPSHLHIDHRPIDAASLPGGRRFADGISSWVVVRPDGDHELVVFDRPAGSERDMVVLAEATGATLVQRHPSGIVRMVGTFGVLRFDGLRWHHEPPVKAWIDAVSACGGGDDERRVLQTMLEFAVHDLGARGTGATLVHRRVDDPLPEAFQLRLPTPPPLDIGEPADLAPLRHVLAQVDGAAIFDRGGILRHLGVRLVPSQRAEAEVEGYRGMRHTSGRRYSFDDPDATVVVVSEDGPVTVLRNGMVLGSSQGSGPLLDKATATDA
jgi:hypothetical protein